LGGVEEDLLNELLVVESQHLNDFSGEVFGLFDLEDKGLANLCFLFDLVGDVEVL